MRLSHIMVSLPLLLCATQLTKPFSLAQAGPMDAAQATTLLAKSQAIDVKCKVLSADKSQELKDYVARAEISLAEKASVAAARKSIAAGRAEGKITACDATASKLVNDVLIAANAATTEMVDDETVQQPKAEPDVAQKVEPQDKPEQVALVVPKDQPVKAKPVTAAAPKLKPIVKAEKVEKPTKTEKLPKAAKGLGSYAVLAEKYFVARRCRNVSGAQIGKMYQAVLATHSQAMASNKPGQVRAMLRAAEARAGGKSCG